MNNIIRFSTGRNVGGLNQTFKACQLSDGRIFFKDTSRDIHYTTKTPCALTQAAIIQAYEAGDCVTPFWALTGERPSNLDELLAASRAVQ